MAATELSCQIAAKLAFAMYYQLYIKNTNASVELYCFRKQKLPAPIDKSDLNVVSLVCVCGAAFDRLNGAGNVLQTWCRNWRSTHDVFISAINKEIVQ